VTATIRPIIVTADLDRLLAFYTELFGATEVMRFPADGPVFYVGLSLGDSELGLSSDASVVAGDPGRMLLSIDVPDVDALLPRVGELGGTDGAGANDMPWGQRVAHIKDPDGNVVNLTQTL
jgi:predicted enzyme related to lactoylglutathione lyase